MKSRKLHGFVEDSLENADAPPEDRNINADRNLLSAVRAFGSVLMIFISATVLIKR